MKRLILILTLSLFASHGFAQDSFDSVEVKALAVSENIYMLTGAGGNIGILVGDDGVLMIDDQYLPLGEKIASAIAGVTDAKLKYIVNTHYHGDHSGGNAYFASEHETTIFAHDNVRIRLANAEDVAPKALPVVTYNEGVKFHMNNETVHVFHLPTAHTDGDSVVWFEKANVLHAGDLFFNNMFPYVDLGGGGNVQGYMDAIAFILGKIDEDTKIIPGHGELANKGDYARVLEMISDTYRYVQAKKSEGMSEQQIIDAGLDEKWDEWSWRFITTERWIKTLFQ